MLKIAGWKKTWRITRTFLLLAQAFSMWSTATSGTCHLQVSGSASSWWRMLTSLKMSGRPSELPLRRNIAFLVLGNSSQTDSRIGCKLKCSSNAEPRRYLCRKALRQWSMMTRGGFLPGICSSGAIGSPALKAVPWGLMSLQIKTQIQTRISFYRQLS